VRSAARSNYWLFGIAVVVQLIALYLPRAPSEGGGHGVDKVVHAAIFAAVVWTGRRAGLPYVWLVLVCAVHGPLSEWVQSRFLPHRDGSVDDAIADLVGVAIGAVLPTRRGPRPRERMTS
jgi:VanZ family protein